MSLLMEPMLAAEPIPSGDATERKLSSSFPSDEPANIEIPISIGRNANPDSSFEVGGTVEEVFSLLQFDMSLKPMITKSSRKTVKSVRFDEEAIAKTATSCHESEAVQQDSGNILMTFQGLEVMLIGTVRDQSSEY